MLRPPRVSLIVLGLVVAVALPLSAQKTAKPSIPAAIDAAFKKAYPSAVIKAVSKEKEGGKEVYEVESVDKGMRRDLIYTSDGQVVSYEEEIAESALPAPVSDAIKKRYPKASKSRIEKVFEHDKISYEIALKGGPSSVTLTPEGQWISPKPGK